MNVQIPVADPCSFPGNYTSEPENTEVRTETMKGVGLALLDRTMRGGWTLSSLGVGGRSRDPER